MNAAVKGRTNNILTLLEKGADVNARDSFGYTALMHAAASKNEETVMAILNCGQKVDVNACANNNGRMVISALTIARRNNLESIVTLLEDQGVLEIADGT